jgi:hypothetical protein
MTAIEYKPLDEALSVLIYLHADVSFMLNYNARVAI